MSDFESFLKKYFEAIKNEDAEFIKKVYGDWLETAGIVPEGQEDAFYKAVFGDLKQLLGGSLVRTDAFDDFVIAHLKDDNGEFSLTFQKKGDSYIYFNERTNFTSFKLVYTLGYNVKGGKLRMLFNGKRSPVVNDIEADRNGMMSPINAALKVGENELTLQSLDGVPVQVSLQISSAKAGEIADSSASDTLDWEGEVKEPVTLKFKTE